MGRVKDSLRRFHQARWDEEMIFELSVPGERGVGVPQAEAEVAAKGGDGLSDIPQGLRRRTPPALPEVHQMRVLRHFLRLSQETMGPDLAPDISRGTCTMKYSPRVQEHLAARHPGLVEVHPLQPAETIQGILEIYYLLEQYLKEISGLDAFTFQPAGGAPAIYTNAAVIRAFQAQKGQRHRDEIVTTIFSHPANAAAPAAAGYRVITLMPDETGYPDLEALKAALSERTAGIFITNPEDTGLYNPRIDLFVQAAHDKGALCAYDQANANALLGIARAREAGFDLCHFNLHKTFSAPHGCGGPAVGAAGVRDFLAPFLPAPRVEFDGRRYFLDYDRPQSVGRIRTFLGNAPVVFKAYAWIRQMGAAGLKEAAECSVLNSNYLEKKLKEIPGVSVRYGAGKRRLEQVRYSWERLTQDTGVTTEDVLRRLVDYGLPHYMMSHHPWVVPQPFTLEPCESYSLADLEEYLAVLRRISQEAYENPELVKSSPHRAAIHRIVDPHIDQMERIAVTWRQYQKKKKAGSGPS